MDEAWLLVLLVVAMFGALWWWWWWEKRKQLDGEREKQRAYEAIPKVVIVDIRMPFGEMVLFILKWAAASVPAGIVVFLTATAVLALFRSLFGP